MARGRQERSAPVHGRGHTGMRHRAPSRKSGADQEVPAGLRLLSTLPLPIWRRIIVFSLFFAPSPPLQVVPGL